MKHFYQERLVYLRNLQEITALHQVLRNCSMMLINHLHVRLYQERRVKAL
jgi:hypothetical protein